MDIIFEDNHLLCVSKPAGLLTQPSGTQQENLEDKAKAWLKEKYQKKGNVFLHAIHRLDKPVSGLVLFAKSAKALSRLNEAIRQKKIKKTYLALLQGQLPAKKGLLENPLQHKSFRAQIDENGKPARLSFHVIETKSNLSLVEIVLDTGRYHQIRVQFAEIGCPILGDEKYGSSSPYHKKGIALHHFRLEFFHPVTNEWLLLESPPPFSISG